MSIRDLFNPVKNFKFLFHSPSEHISAFDFFRALAMLWIVCKHSVQVYYALFQSGEDLLLALDNPLYKPLLSAEFGVDIFFVLSGFLIGTIIFKEYKKTAKLNIGRFYIRRILRMVPIYYFVMILIISFRAAELLPDLWDNSNPLPNFFYLNNFWTIDGFFMRWTWSLAVEEQFYFLFPILIYGFTRLKFSIGCNLFCGIVLCMFFHYVVLNNHKWELFWTPFPTQNFAAYSKYFNLVYIKPYIRFSTLFIGAFAAHLKIQNRESWMWNSKIKTAVTLSMAVVSIGTAYGFQNYHKLTSIWFQCIYRELFAIGFVLIILFVSKYRSPVNSYVRKVFYPIFQLSYGIYLIHVFVLFYLYRNFSIIDYFQPMNITPFLGSFLVGLLAFAISSVIVIPMYVFVERPFMNWRQIKFPSA